MATANPLEEQLSCSICFEVYRDPHLLKECQHTFCHPCLQRLENGGRIECPECRTITAKENIVRDFKTQSFIDAVARKRELDEQKSESVKRQKKDGSITGSFSKICEMCNKVGQVAKYHCKECQQFMCEECQNTHKGMKLCQRHTVKSIHKILNDSETEMKNLIKCFEKEKMSINFELLNIDRDIKKFRNVENGQILDVEKYSEEIIKHVKENEKKLKKMIKDGNANVLASLEERKRLFRKGAGEIQDKIKSLENLMKDQDMSARMEALDRTKLNMKKSVDQIKATLPSRSRYKSPVQVQKGQELDLKPCIRVTVSRTETTIQQVKPILRPMYSDLCKNKFTQNKVMELNYVPCKLVEVDNDIWCGGEKFITVFNQTGCKIKTISHWKLQFINGFCVISDHVIVATKNNLHQLDRDGNYQRQVGVGTFADVCYRKGALYALQCNSSNSNQLVILKNNNGFWQCERCISLQYTNVKEDDKLCIVDLEVYISSWYSKCISIYDLNGQRLTQASQEGSSSIYLCDRSDLAGNILVADYINHQIQIYNRRAGWKVVSDTGKLSYPRYALVDIHGNIWVGSSKSVGNQSLLKLV